MTVGKLNGSGSGGSGSGIFGSSSGHGKPQPRRRTRNQQSTPEWHELGDFFVSFGYVMRNGKRQLQTRAYYSQGDLFMAWDGVTKEDLLDWILEQTQTILPASERNEPEQEEKTNVVAMHPASTPEEYGELDQLEPPASAPTLSPAGASLSHPEDVANPEGYLEVRANTNPAAHSDVVDPGLRNVSVELVDMQLSSPPVAASAGSGTVPVLRASGNLRLDRSGRRGAHNGAAYRVDLFLVDRDTRDHPETRVATQFGNLRANEFMQNVQLEFPVPTAGSYRLKSVITLLPSGQTGVQPKGPELRVE